MNDTGAGIAKEDISKLFTRFGKLHRTAQINSAGIGLGLTIVKQIIESCNGHIEVRSDGVNMGSSVLFSMQMEEVPNDRPATHFVQKTFMEPILPKPKIEKAQNYVQEKDDVNISDLEASLENSQRDGLFVKLDDFLFADRIAKSPRKGTPEEEKLNILKQKNPPAILIIDDDQMNIEVIQSLLEHLGFTCDTATSGRSGIELIQNRLE